MDRAFESGAIGVAPTVPAIPSVGFPTGGNPVGGVPATKPGAHWFHMVTEELRALIVAGGLTPSPSVVDQVLQALPAALASRPELARSLSANGYQRLPGGLIVQWGSATTNGSGDAIVTFPLAFPTAGRVALGNSGSTTGIVSVGDPTTTGVTFFLRTSAGAAVTGSVVRYIVIGY